MKKILVIQTASIGDVILATPVLEALNQRYPQAKIDLVVKQGMDSLFSEHPFLHQVLVWNKTHRKHKHLLTLIAQIRRQKYDLVINLQRFLSSGLLTVFSGAEHTVGFDKNPLSILFSERKPHQIGTPNAAGYMHETERNLSLLSSFNITVQPFRPKLYLPPSADRETQSYKQTPYLTLSPASLWFTKAYPKEQWIRFLHAIPPTYTVYLLGSKTDIPLCEDLRQAAIHGKVENLAGKLSLLSSASLMQHADMNYVNDSAPLHLCSAVNGKVTAIFCSTVPEFGFTPLSDHSQIVQTPIPLACRPCGIHGYRRCPQQHFRCGFAIETEQLLATLR